MVIFEILHHKDNIQNGHWSLRELSMKKIDIFKANFHNTMSIYMGLYYRLD